jgi:hypothetical protein
MSTQTKDNEEQMFFVPSLLSNLQEGETHRSIEFWKQIKHKYVSILGNTHFP